jgi:hypothetical protein
MKKFFPGVDSGSSNREDAAYPSEGRGCTLPPMSITNISVCTGQRHKEAENSRK